MMDGSTNAAKSSMLLNNLHKLLLSLYLLNNLMLLVCSQAVTSPIGRCSFDCSVLGALRLKLTEYILLDIIDGL